MSMTKEEVTLALTNTGILIANELSKLKISRLMTIAALYHLATFEMCERGQDQEVKFPLLETKLGSLLATLTNTLETSDNSDIHTCHLDNLTETQKKTIGLQTLADHKKE